MRVSFISPWNIRGGIYTYQKYLIEGFQDLGEPIDVDVTRLARFHDVDVEYLEKHLAKKATRNDPDVVHIQQEGARYGFEEAALYDALEGRCERIVTTIHSAQQLTDEQKDIILHRSDKAFVHNERELRALYPYAKDTPIIVPHGCHMRNPPPKAKACVPLGIDPLPECVALTHGFLGPWKRVEQVIDAIHKLTGVTHVHAGEWHTSLPHGHYAQQVRQLADYRIPERHQWTGYVEEENYDNVFGIADFAVYANAWASESGSMAEMLGAGVPVIARDIAPFNDGRPVVLFEDENELEDAIRRLRDDDELRADLSERGLEWARQRRWPRVARIHRHCYDYVLGEQNWRTNYQIARRIEHVKFLRHLWDAGGDRMAAFADGYEGGSQISQMIPEYTRNRLLGDKILDVGCRVGALARYVADRTDLMATWYGVDILDEYTEIAYDTGHFYDTRTEPAEDMSWDDDQFETVVIQEVLEHLPDQGLALEEAWRVLEPGGRLIVTMPNTTEDPSPIEHMGPRTPSELQALAEDKHFETIECMGLLGLNNIGNLKSNTVGTFQKPEA